MKKYVVGLVTVVLLVLALPAIASASPAPRMSPSGVAIMWTGKKLVVHHDRAIAHAASAGSCIASWNTQTAMYFVHSGGGPGGGDTYEAWGKQHCGDLNNYNQTLEVCMGQLVTGGWQVINSSCLTVSGVANALSTPSHWVGLTVGRWYEPWLYQWVQGPQYTYGFWGPSVKG